MIKITGVKMHMILFTVWNINQINGTGILFVSSS